jgi:hypothetical protein
MLAVRPVPAAGLFLTLTRRCPLACAHCSTNSMLSSEQHPALPFERLVDSFTLRDHPELVLFTGGEPLLRPGLVTALAQRSHEVGTASAMITGGYFARESARVSAALWRALTSVDHVIFSLDVFHERQVSRRAVFAVVGRLLAAGQAVSFQLVGTGADDPYLREVTADLRHTFRDAVPALVVRLGEMGRARNLRLGQAPRCPVRQSADPCTMAAWPVVAFDGTIVACCNQDVVDGPAPEHLRLGHASTLSWAELADRVRGDALLRALRVVGPQYLTAASADAPTSPGGYCASCHQLPARPAALAAARQMTARPTFAIVEQQAEALQAGAGAHGFARVFGIREYADLVLLGRPGRSGECAS